MATALDVTLDDLIKNSKRTGGGVNSRGRGSRGAARGTAFGPSRRFSNRFTNRAAPYTSSKAPESSWQHDMFVGQANAYSSQQPNRLPSLETGTKLYISNLDYGVSNEDIKELFLEVGDLKRYTIHYDRSGRSKGTAEVVFSKRADAMAAVKRYHNVELDGKPMKIDIVGTNAAPAAPLPPPTSGVFLNSNNIPRSGGGQWRVGVGGRFRGGGFGGVRGFGRGRGRGGGGGGSGGGFEKILAEDLDADLEKYHADAMQIN